MNHTDMQDKKKKIFYGWWIVAASCLAAALSGGFYFYGFSNYFMPLTREFGWSRTAISGVYSLSRLEGGLIGPVGGLLIDRFGPRKVMLFGIILMGGGFILLSQINSLLAFCLVFILLISLGGTLAIHQAVIVAITNWFVKKRGTAIGLGWSGIGLGGIFVPIIAWIIVEHGWREAAIVSGLIVLIVGIPLSMVMRQRPEQYGYLPDGESADEAELAVEKPLKTSLNFLPGRLRKKESFEEIDFTIQQALRSKEFWMLALAFGLRQFVISAVVIHQIPFLTGIGISPEVAATTLGSIALVSIVGRLGYGRIADIVEKRHVMAVCLLLTSTGCIILANAQTLWHVIVFVIVYAPAYGGGAILMNAIRGEFFGRKQFGTIMGFMDFVQMFGTVLGPIFAGWIFDVTDSYRLAFTSFAATSAMAMVLILILRRPVPK